jgi:hypothetical protein
VMGVHMEPSDVGGSGAPSSLPAHMCRRQCTHEIGARMAPGSGRAKEWKLVSERGQGAHQQQTDRQQAHDSDTS